MNLALAIYGPLLFPNEMYWKSSIGNWTIKLAEYWNAFVNDKGKFPIRYNLSADVVNKETHDIPTKFCLDIYIVTTIIYCSFNGFLDLEGDQIIQS